MKRRTKQRDNERKKAEKAEKASALPSRPKKEKSAEDTEGELNPNVCILLSTSGTPHTYLAMTDPISAIFRDPFESNQQAPRF